MTDIHGNFLTEEELAALRGQENSSAASIPQARTLSGRAVAKVLRPKFLEKAKRLRAEGRHPTLALVSVGDDPASSSYARNITRQCELCGVASVVVEIDESRGQRHLEETLKELGEDAKIHGIIMLSPLPEGFNEVVARALIPPDKDLDALHYHNTAKFYLKGSEPMHYPPTIGGALLALDLYGVDIRRKRVAVMGRGNLVGRPMGFALMDVYDCSVTYLHSQTPDPHDFLLQAEVIVGATGKPHAIDHQDVPEGAVLLDMGVHLKNDQIVGEFTKDAYEKSSWALRSPGGSGTLTVLYLISNCLNAAERVLPPDHNS